MYQIVTNAVIEAVLKRAKDGSTRKNTRTLAYEFVGENGALVIANCEVSNVSKFVHTLRTVRKQHKKIQTGSRKLLDKWPELKMVSWDGFEK